MRNRFAFAAPALAAALVLGACQESPTRPLAPELGPSLEVTSEADPFPCVGVAPPGTYDNVVVPPGAQCTLNGSTIRGTVKALEDSRLFMNTDIVHGNVEGYVASAVILQNSTVYGNVHIIEGHDPVVQSAVVFRNILPNGNIQVEKGRFPFGDWVVSRNTLQKGNIKVEANQSIFGGFTRFNDVAQDVQVFKNTEDAIFVEFNVIGENLQCNENVVAIFSGQPNVVGGNAEDQCAGPGMASASASEETGSTGPPEWKRKQ